MEHYQKYIAEGYTEEQAFYLAEIKTTQQMLVDLQNMGNYSPTLLLNSLLSMIVLPYEKAKNSKYKFLSDDKFVTFEKKLGIPPTLFQPIGSCKDCKVSYNKKTVKVFINKLRNGIAHQNISVSIRGDKDFSITIKNKYQSRDCNKCANPTCKEKGLIRENGGVIDFQITVTVEQLRKLADYIANAYLKAIQQGE